ncbi:MAG: adenylate/guanylate cyclase domain-containing protein [Rhizobiaceae bacterium]
MLGRLRLISGLILFVFVLGHLTNHALGIVSLGAMNDGLKYTIEPWRTVPGTLLITTALTVHAVLAVWALYCRRSLRMKPWEAFQLVTGFLVPVMLVGHVLATRGANEVFGLEEGYALQLYLQWIAQPYYGILITSALLVVWTHACIGWHYWLRLKPWYSRVKTVAFALALLVPALALAGIISAIFRVVRLSRSEKWETRLLSKVSELGSEFPEFVQGNELAMQFMVFGVVGTVLLIHFARKIFDAKRGEESLTYRDVHLENHKTIRFSPGQSALDMIRNSGFDHPSVCGGKGRCSTCRVRVDEGLETLAEPSNDELRVLSRISAPPNVRLACQLHPVGSLAVTALLQPGASARDGFERTPSQDGDEQQIAVLFADIRAFTKLSETRLPYDTAFLLNRYFAAMGKAIEQEGGHVDKFIGDGVMALFGINENLETGCQKAIKAAAAMSTKLEELNQSLKNDLVEPLRIGIGVHSGTAIVGTMGYNRATGLTAIGDVVNTASRLESMTKDYSVQFVVSDTTVEKSGFDLAAIQLESVKIRGREESLPVRIVPDASKLF